MPSFGQEPQFPLKARSRGWLGGALTIAVCLPGLGFSWGYMVDDALISARVSDHISRGFGSRFNGDGSIVDAVTPLGYAHLLALLGGTDVLSIWNHARVLGAAAWLVAAFLLGRLVLQERGSRLKLVPLGVLGLCVPPATWAVSGMETGLVTLLATLALFWGRAGAFAAGLAAAWRPELLPWSASLVVGGVFVDYRASPPRERALSMLKSLAIVLSPALAVAALRYASFGAVTPLAVYAKPSDLTHGLRYAVGGSLFLGIPILLLAPKALRQLRPRHYVVAAALMVHFLALVAAGGDWMALYRLWVPVIPGMVVLSAAVQARSSLPATGLRALTASAICLMVTVLLGVPARRVAAQRIQLIEAARPFLAQRRVAALDVGWVGAATSSTVIDLAGVTDPRVAKMPGGHTTKRIPRSFLDNERVQMLVLLLAPGARPATPWQKSGFMRQVEGRVARQYSEFEGRVVAELPLGQTRQEYVFVQLK